MFSWVAMAFFIVLTIKYLLQTWRSTHRYISNKLPPGPLGLPLIGHLHLLGDQPHCSLHKLSQKYGPVMQLRLGLVPTVVVSSAQMVELFLKKHDLNFMGRPKTQASEHLCYGTRGVFFSDGAYWRNARKLCTIHLLSLSKVNSFKPLRREEVTSLIKSLKKAAESRQVIDISAQIESFIENISYRMIFGNEYKVLPQFKHCVEELLRLITTVNIVDFIPFLEPFDFQGLKRRMKKVSSGMDGFLEEILVEHEENYNSKQDDQRDFIDIMLSIHKSDSANVEKLSRGDIKAIILDMVEGMSDTSASTIEWILTELIKHPEIMAQVRRELSTVVGTDRMVEEEDLAKLVYLDLVIKEVMRVHPVAPISPRKSIEDITIEGYHVPKATLVLINVWAVGRDPNVWSENAEKFYPERFINNDVDVRGNNFQLIPLGAGRRRCAGTEIGLRTIKLMLAQVLHCFDLELPNGMSPGELDTRERLGTPIRRVNPLFVVPTYRLPTHNI